MRRCERRELVHGSEFSPLTAARVDLAGGLLRFESLKKRRRGIHRATPVPPSLLDALDLVHGIRKQQGHRGKGPGRPPLAVGAA